MFSFFIVVICYACKNDKIKEEFEREKNRKDIKEEPEGILEVREISKEEELGERNVFLLFDYVL